MYQYQYQYNQDIIKVYQRSETLQNQKNVGKTGTW